MKARQLLTLLAAALVLASCDNDDTPAPKPQEQDAHKNENANTLYTTYSRRLEMPRLQQDEVNNLFRVKTVPTYGVNYSYEFDCKKRATRWVAFRWDIDNSVDNNIGRSEMWDEDTQIPELYRVTTYDHNNDGFDRGHMLASEDRQNSKEANAQTFLMSNIHPQYNSFNASPFVWGNMENYVRRFYLNWTPKKNAQDTIYAVKGGTIGTPGGTIAPDDQILMRTNKGLIVPKYFYMAFLYKNTQAAQGGYKAIAFWVEHTNGTDRTAGNDLKKYAISIDSLETLTGIDFFCNLPDDIEDVVESNCTPKAWGFTE